jgi:predicted nucleic acid-binding protein
VSAIIVDTGPLVAYLNAGDENHAWAVRQFASLHEPVLTCDAVWVETMHLYLKRGGSAPRVWILLRSGTVKLAFHLDTEFESVAQLMDRYADVPMDLADACLVRMSEQHRDCRVFTTDSDFKIYRRYGRQVIPLISL